MLCLFDIVYCKVILFINRVIFNHCSIILVYYQVSRLIFVMHCQFDDHYAHFHKGI